MNEPTIYDLLQQRITLLAELQKARVAHMRMAGRSPLAREAALQEVQQKQQEVADLRQQIKNHPDYTAMLEGMQV